MEKNRRPPGTKNRFTARVVKREVSYLLTWRAAKSLGALVPRDTLRQLLVHPKDKLGKDRIVGPVYRIQCNTDNCEASYIGETERSFKARFSEHRRPSTTSSEVSKHNHKEAPGHSIDLENTDILTVEPRWFERGVKEAIYIRAYSPSLNRDGGRYQLPPIWNTLIKQCVEKRGTGTSERGDPSNST